MYVYACVFVCVVKDLTSFYLDFCLLKFPVGHYVNFRTARLNNENKGYVFAFIGDEQVSCFVSFYAFCRLLRVRTSMALTFEPCRLRPISCATRG